MTLVAAAWTQEQLFSAALQGLQLPACSSNTKCDTHSLNIYVTGIILVSDVSEISPLKHKTAQDTGAAHTSSKPNSITAGEVQQTQREVKTFVILLMMLNETC